MTGHWKFCELMALSDILNRNLCMIKAAAFAQGQIVLCLKEPRHRFLVTAYPFRLAARCQKGLLYQVLRKMPVPYATICKPDHSIRVLKHQMMDVLSLLLIHTIPSFAKSHQKNQLPCNQQPAADLFELVALAMLHNRFAHRQAQFDLLRRGIFQHACKFNRNADVRMNRNVASKQSVKINAQCCRYIHQ